MKLAFMLHAYAIWLGLCVLSSAAHAVALRLAQVRVCAFRLFAGGTVARFSIGGVMFELGWVPVGTSVTYDVPTFWLRPTWMQVAATLVGPLALLPCAAAVLGSSLAWHHFLTGFVQLPVGALHPLSVGRDLITRLHGLSLGSVPAAAGVLAAKLAASEFLPLGGLATAQVLLALIGPGNADDGEVRGARFLTLSALVLILIMAGWVVAAVAYVILT